MTTTRATAHTALPVPASLAEAAQSARGRGEPLVVMTTLERCPYCDVVRNHHLLPMLRDQAVVAVQIDVRDTRRNLRGFDGTLTSPADQASAWKARFTPTVLFFDDRGHEIAERLVGVAVPDFYGSYLDARLESARSRLRK
ncbi:MAG: thioredoxin fold domain-containing protein [Hydrogenophaga sp.]|jgi:thioredoxin-related protein|nr:thioredoxin fold domain-containing protein [Hydrogenophaga sp.]